MKINWFSPLPSAKTSIAYTTGILLPALTKQAEVTLWTDQLEWDQRLEQWAEVRRFNAAALDYPVLNRAEMTFYNIGNNSLFHSGIWSASQQFQGTAILHDLWLQHFFAGYYKRSWAGRAGYVAEMQRYYGEPGRHAAESFWTGHFGADDLAERFPLTPLALRNTLGVVVHTRGAFAEVKQMGRRPIAYLSLPETARPSLSRETSTSSVPPYRLVMFGHMGANRRIESILEALAGLPQRDQFRLDIYGDLWNEPLIRARIGSLNLHAIVRLVGFVADEDLERVLSQSDLGINLRYPSMGEASGSQLRLWAHSLPSLVTQVGFYADLPADTVAFVRPNHEIEDIRLHLGNFLAHPERFRQLGMRGREFLVKHHSPEDYVKGLLQIVKLAREFGPDFLASKLAERAGMELGNWLETDQLELSCHRTSQAVSAMFC